MPKALAASQRASIHTDILRQTGIQSGQPVSQRRRRIQWLRDLWQPLWTYFTARSYARQRMATYMRKQRAIELRCRCMSYEDEFRSTDLWQPHGAASGGSSCICQTDTTHPDSRCAHRAAPLVPLHNSDPHQRAVRLRYIHQCWILRLSPFRRGEQITPQQQEERAVLATLE